VRGVPEAAQKPTADREESVVATIADLAKRFPQYEWRFVSWQASVKHAIDRHGSNAEITSNNLAICGNSPVWFTGVGWLGSGNQKEYEALDELRECKKCLRLLGEQGQEVRPNGGGTDGTI